MLSIPTSLLPLVLLLASCVCSCHSSAVIDSTSALKAIEYRQAYKQIGDYLSKELKGNDDAAANINRAKVWLETEVKSGSDTSLISATELFSSLSSILDGDKCSKKNLDIIAANDLATEGRSRSVDEMNEVRPLSKSRVVRVVNNYAIQHAKACQDVYASRYYAAVAQLDPVQLKRVQELLDQVIVMSYFHKSRVYGIKRLNRLYNDIIMRPDPVQGVDSPRSYYIVMMDLTEHEPEEAQYMGRVLDRVNGGKFVHRDQIEKLFTKYLVEPCRYYIREMGADIFVPARFEANWYHEIKETEHDYYYGWARYRFCESFLTVDHEPLINGIVNLAEMS